MTMGRTCFSEPAVMSDRSKPLFQRKPLVSTLVPVALLFLKGLPYFSVLGLILVNHKGVFGLTWAWCSFGCAMDSSIGGRQRNSATTTLF